MLHQVRSQGVKDRPATPCKSDKYTIAFTAFAAWRIDISYTGGGGSKY